MDLSEQHIPVLFIHCEFRIPPKGIYLHRKRGWFTAVVDIEISERMKDCGGELEHDKRIKCCRLGRREQTVKRFKGRAAAKLEGERRASKW